MEIINEEKKGRKKEEKPMRKGREFEISTDACPRSALTFGFVIEVLDACTQIAGPLFP